MYSHVVVLFAIALHCDLVLFACTRFQDVIATQCNVTWNMRFKPAEVLSELSSTQNQIF